MEGVQTNLTEYFEGAVGSGTSAPRRKVAHRSKRLSKAVANLRSRQDSDDAVQEIAPRRMKTKRKRPAIETVKIEINEEGNIQEGSSSIISDVTSDDIRRGGQVYGSKEKWNKERSKGGKSSRRSKKLKG